MAKRRRRDTADTLPVVSWYWNDWRGSGSRARFLSAENFLAGWCYRELLDAHWMTPDCSLPNDDAELAAMAGVSLRRWLTVRDEVLRNMKTLPNGRIRNSRTYLEWLEGKKNRAVNRARASAGGKAKSRKQKGPIDKDAPSTLGAGAEHAQDVLEPAPPYPSPPPSPVTDTDNHTGKAPTAAEWRAADGRTLPQIAEAVIAFGRGLPDLLPVEACRKWCDQNSVPEDLRVAILTAIERAHALGVGYDDFGPPGAHEVLITEGEPLVKFIAEREGLDATEVVGTASEHDGHRYLMLRQIPANRHKRLIHTVNALRAWVRRLEGKPEPKARASPAPRLGNGVGERSLSALERAAARRGINATGAGAGNGRGVGAALHAGGDDAPRELPPASGRRDP